MSSATSKSPRKVQLLGKDILPGSSQTLSFKVARLFTRNDIQVPIHVERAMTDGPVLLLLGGVHGDEINGVEIVRRLVHEDLHIPECGTVIAMPVFNIFGFLDATREFPDGRDLNRSFPGSEDGSLASQFAYRFKKQIAPHVDYVIDFHTGSSYRSNMPQIRCEATNERALTLAKVFGAPYIIYSSVIKKSLRELFYKLGKTYLLFEGGTANWYDQEAIACGVEGTRRIMATLGMRPYSNPATLNPPVVIEKSRWIRAPQSGMLQISVANGTYVQAKTVLGIISDPFGSSARPFRAPRAGWVFCVSYAPVVNRGDALVHLGW